MILKLFNLIMKCRQDSRQNDLKDTRGRKISLKTCLFVY